MLLRSKLVIMISLLLTGCGSAPLLSNGGHLISTSDQRIDTWNDLKIRNIEMQEYDYSCGAASLATLMRYYFADPVTEKSILNDIDQLFTAEELAVIENLGLSFLELEIIAKSKGYQTASVRLSVSDLQKLQGPVLVFVQPNNYRHFAILRGVVEDRVYLADPSRGNIRLALHEFLKEWNGETFVLGKEGFGLPQNHALAIKHQQGFRNELSILRERWRIRPNFQGKISGEFQ